jgi:hypothetical protein
VLAAVLHNASSVAVVVSSARLIRFQIVLNADKRPADGVAGPADTI